MAVLLAAALGVLHHVALPGAALAEGLPRPQSQTEVPAAAPLPPLLLAGPLVAAAHLVVPAGLGLLEADPAVLRPLDVALERVAGGNQVLVARNALAAPGVIEVKALQPKRAGALQGGKRIVVGILVKTVGPAVTEAPVDLADPGGEAALDPPLTEGNSVQVVLGNPVLPSNTTSMFLRC